VAWAGAVTSAQDREKERTRKALVRQAQAGQLAVDKAVAALKVLKPQDYPLYMIGRLLETGANVTLAALAAWSAPSPPCGCVDRPRRALAEWPPPMSHRRADREDVTPFVEVRRWPLFVSGCLMSVSLGCDG
jgi:hypothetical protein